MAPTSNWLPTFTHVPLRGYIGSYYFHAHAVNNIGGGAVGLEY